MSDVISIVIPAFNQLSYCTQCVESILNFTERPYKLVLVDNGSTDGVGEFFDGVPGAEAVHSESNLGFAGGVNLGLARVEGHVVLLNSDTLVVPGWLGRLESALLSKPDIGMVGPRTNHAAGEQIVAGLTLDSDLDILACAAGIAETNKNKVREVVRLVGFCIMIRDSVLEKVGDFDESFGIGNYEDDDYCTRVTRAGYRLCIAEDCFVYHFGGRTFSGMGFEGESFDGLAAKNSEVFRRKWNMPPLDETNPLGLAQELNGQAREASEKGDIKRAVELLRKSIEIFPLYEVTHNDLGVVLHKIGKQEMAYECFCRAFRLNREYKEAKANLIKIGEILDKEDEVVAILDEVGERI